MNLDKHPCFNPGACKDNGRVHLPVAPSCNMQCGYCNRDYDCVNESRPGVVSTILTPWQAIGYLEKVSERVPVSVVGIAGPGDPFANPAETLETMELVRIKYPEMLLCVATNGLNLFPFIPDLEKLKVSHVTLTVNAVDPEVGQAMYRWMRMGPRRYRGLEAAELLLANQKKSILELKKRGILVKVNTVVVPGLNDHHTGRIAETVAGWGADYMNCMAMIPVEGALFGDIREPDIKEMGDLRREAGQFVKQMSHCRRCRADAAGLLEEASVNKVSDLLAEAASQPGRNPLKEHPFDSGKPCVAVASREGLMINRHLGEVGRFLVYRREGEGYRFFEDRPAPPPGGGDDRWRHLAATLSDCSHLLVSSAGKTPIDFLGAAGIKVQILEGIIDEALGVIHNGGDLGYMAKRTGGVCTQGRGGCN
jgi:nitrogen fixation protein NifB